MKSALGSSPFLAGLGWTRLGVKVLGPGLTLDGSGLGIQQVLFQVHFLVTIHQYVNDVRLTAD